MPTTQTACPPSAVVDQIIPWAEVREGDLLLWDGEFRRVEHINPKDYGVLATALGVLAVALDGDQGNATVPAGNYAAVRRYQEGAERDE